ncbi:MAG: hypothetical protein DSY81_09910 [Bacillota bacterium]|nr:MAG: hypothetical protein DSY81_09910 [Bacillota bacterium]
MRVQATSRDRVIRRGVSLTAFLLLLGAGIFLRGDSSLAGNSLAGHGSGTPKIVCEEPIVEWGELIKGSPFHHTFQIKNEGDAVLIIQKVNGT